MKLLYITTKDFSRGMSDGVVKKIKCQIKCFANNGFSVDYVYRDSSRKEMLICSDGQIESLGKFGLLPGIKTKSIINDFLDSNLKDKEYDCCFIRFLGGRVDPWFLRILSLLKRNKIKICVEIPTFPYDNERKSVDLIIDKLCRGFLKKYVDRIVTYSLDREIYGIKTIHIFNGIDVDSIVPRHITETSVINLIAVASFEKAHGYERIIESLYNYYSMDHKKEIVLHLIGNGADKALYEELVSKYQLEDKVYFYGQRSGAELDEIYDKSDVAISCLGLYKKGLEVSSALKVREYLSKGLPIISACTEDVLEGKSLDFYLKFPNDDSKIDIDVIINWYEKLIDTYGSKKMIYNEIREFAYNNVDMQITMKEVIDYFKEGRK